MSFDGFSLAPLVVELDRRLAGGRVEKIFQSDAYTLVFWIRQAAENLRILISVNPTNPRILLTDLLPENPAVPPAFCMLLRKHLEDGRIAGLEQHSLDRMVTLSVDVRGEGGVIVTKKLVLELMGKHSNIILIQDSTILDAIKRIGANISSYRQVFPGREYLLPPGQDRMNLFDTPPADFIKMMKENSAGFSLEKSLIRTGIGIGPQTAREILWRAGLPGKLAVDQMDIADEGALIDGIESLLTPLKNGVIQPVAAVDQEDRLLALAPYPLEHLGTHRQITFPTMSELMAFSGRYHAPPAVPGKDSLRSVVTGELNRLQRKEGILRQELGDSQDADIYRQYGDLLMANLFSLKEGTAEAQLADLYAERPEEQLIAVKMDVTLSPLKNAQNYYARYNKAKRAQESLVIQQQQCIEDLGYLDSVAVALSYAETAAEVHEIRQEMIDAGYIKSPAKRRMSVTASLPLAAVTSDNWDVLIGRNNRQNDLVTFKKSHHDDIWMHTKDIPGSHVILRTGSGEPTAAALKEAALLAAYFSKSRHSSQVPVDYTRRRYVKKPAGSKPGFVIYDHQSTLYVTPEENLVKELLNRRRKKEQNQ